MYDLRISDTIFREVAEFETKVLASSNASSDTMDVPRMLAL